MTQNQPIKPVKKALFPVAGLGTRFLPATKVLPKEMLPLVDRPLIQRAVEEAIEAGIEEFIFITGRGKSLITEHFEFQPELIQTLERTGKDHLLAKVRNTDMASGKLFTTIQQEPKGLGHAVYCARNLIGDEPFALFLPDVMVLSQGPNCMAQMIDVYQKTGGNIIASAFVPNEQVYKYGILDVENPTASTSAIRGMVEKPAIDKAPSNLSILGRYILQPEIFEVLSKQSIGAGGEIQLTDAMRTLMGQQSFTSYTVTDPYYDCGHQIGFIEANIAFALKDPHFGPMMQEILNRYTSTSQNRYEQPQPAKLNQSKPGQSKAANS